ncbi:MAG: hypothetical protein Q4Q07_09175, partial [Tissierellia bacterium]|nr:hypothetical protein [Tissierellia bacterium]
TRKDKDFNVLFSSKDCFYCTEYMDQLYLYLKTLEGKSYSFDMDGLSEEGEKILDAIGLEEIPAILVVKGGKQKLISPEELYEKGVIQIEK